MFAVDLARVFGMTRIVVPAAAGVGSAVGIAACRPERRAAAHPGARRDGRQFPSSSSHFRRSCRPPRSRSMGQDPAAVDGATASTSATAGRLTSFRCRSPKRTSPQGRCRCWPHFARCTRAPTGSRRSAGRVRHVPGAGDLPVRRRRRGRTRASRRSGTRAATPVRGGRPSPPSDGFVDVPVLRRADLTTGAPASPGPAFVEGPESTTLLPPGALLTVDTLGTMHLWPDGKDLA